MQLALKTANPEVLSAQEVAELLGVSERTVRRWIAIKKLPAKKTGRSFAIRIDDVEKVLGASLRRRMSARVGEREREQEVAALQAQVELLKEMYEASRAELVDATRQIARLEIELDRPTERVQLPQRPDAPRRSEPMEQRRLLATARRRMEAP